MFKHYEAYRKTNNAKITPINTITQEPSAPPKITGKSADEDKDSLALPAGSRKTENCL